MRKYVSATNQNSPSLVAQSPHFQPVPSYHSSPVRSHHCSSGELTLQPMSGREPLWRERGGWGSRHHLHAPPSSSRGSWDRSKGRAPSGERWGRLREARKGTQNESEFTPRGLQRVDGVTRKIIRRAGSELSVKAGIRSRYGRASRVRRLSRNAGVIVRGYFAAQVACGHDPPKPVPPSDETRPDRLIVTECCPSNDDIVRVSGSLTSVAASGLGDGALGHRVEAASKRGGGAKDTGHVFLYVRARGCGRGGRSAVCTAMTLE